jgi:hypothetical protein
MMRKDPIPTELLLEQHDGLPDDDQVDAVLDGLADALEALGDLGYVVHVRLGLEEIEEPEPAAAVPTLEEVERLYALVVGVRAAREVLASRLALLEADLAAANELRLAA